MRYTVLYKHHTWFFWRRIRNVKGDVVEGAQKIIVQDDETQYHFPIKDYTFRFSRERFLSSKQRVDQDAGQVTQLRRA